MKVHEWTSLEELNQCLQFILSLSDEKCYERVKMPFKIKKDLLERYSIYK